MAEPQPQTQLSRVEPLVWFALTFGIYLGYGATAFYKTDGPDLLWLLHEHRQHPWHVGYLPALSAWRWLLQTLHVDVSWMRLGTSFSAAGMAAGVAAFNAGLQRLGVSPGRRDIAVILLAACPAAMLFATVVELHAPLLAAVGIAFWWTAVQIQRPSLIGMALLGVLTHACFLMHSSGLLLPGWLLPFFLARRWPARGRDWWLAAVAGAVHGLLWFALPRLFPVFYGVHADLAAAFAKETSIARPQSLDWTGVIFLQEWLWPLLPTSALCFTALFVRRLRAEFAAFLLGLAPFLYLCVRQLVFEPENGAYLLPMVLPAVLLTVQALPPRFTACLSAISALLALSAPVSIGLLQRGMNDERADARLEFALADAAGSVEAGGRVATRPFLALFGTHREMATGYARLSPWLGPPQAPVRSFLYIRETAAMPRTTYVSSRLGEGTVMELRRLIDLGVAVLVPERTRDYLADPAQFMRAEKAAAQIPPDMAGPQLLKDLEAAFVFEEASGEEWNQNRVFRLVPK